MKTTRYYDIKADVPICSDNAIRPGSVIHGFGTIVRLSPKRPDKSQCRGCYDDFYNHNRDGGCWAFDSAEVCDKVGHSSIYVANGPDTIKKDTLTCWHAVSK